MLRQTLIVGTRTGVDQNCPSRSASRARQPKTAVPPGNAPIRFGPPRSPVAVLSPPCPLPVTFLALLAPCCSPVACLSLSCRSPVAPLEAGSDPLGHLGVTWGVYLCAGKPPLADIILSHPPDVTRCDNVIGLAIPAMSGHSQYRGAASGNLYIGISGINRVLLS